MRVLMQPRFWRSLRHRLCVAGTFFAYLVASISIPLPASVHKDASQPFPCQDHPCGCRTAEQCWRNCCCFTSEERWAWAREHNVEPPAYAEKPTEKGWNTVKLRDQNKKVSGSATHNSCCENRRTQEARSACCQSGSKHPVHKSPSSRKHVRWLSVMAAWHCQGGQTLWASAGAVLPIARPAAWTPELSPIAWMIFPETSTSPVFLTPSAPPPRSCAKLSGL